MQLQLDNRQLKDRLRVASSGKEHLLRSVESLQERLQVALAIQERGEVPPMSLEASGGAHEAIPVLLCSDWHCGAVVHAKTVNNLGSYDVDEFHGRSKQLFVNAVKVISMVRSRCEVSRMVLWLGGDLIDGWLRDEAMQTQELSPTQQIIECERAIITGIDYLLNHGGIKKLYIPCNFGNHGRNTQKMQADNAHATSYEWLMYQSLRRHYMGDDRIEWQISDGNILYLDILYQRFRYHHGDAIRYGGGVGGIQIPLRKWVYRQDVGIRADHTFIGHFHTLTIDEAFSINGSLIGPTPYSLKLGFPPERPQQLLRFMDSERRRFTISAPIFTD